MTSGTKIRQLARLFDASEAPVWAIAPGGKLVYLSAATARWLGVDGQLLLDRRSVAGSPSSDHPLDQLAAALSPPPGLEKSGTARLRVQPRYREPDSPLNRIQSIDVRFVRVGHGESSLTLAIGGAFEDRMVDQEIDDAAAIRQQLDAWRKRHARLAAIASAGNSLEARRLRARLQVAASVRSHLGFFGPSGCGAESIALRVHQQHCEIASTREPIVVVDGPLMDRELLDAAIVPVVNQLANSADAVATALVRSLDEMPLDAQRHLAEIAMSLGERFRLIGLCHPAPHVQKDPLIPFSDIGADQGNSTFQLDATLVSMIGVLTLTIEPLASRAEDIPLIATAILDARHAAGEGPAERLSRAALDALVLYPWPNNFEELDAAIRHAMRIASGDTIRVEHLPLAIRSYHPDQRLDSPKFSKVSLDEALAKYELRLIEQALGAAAGNRAEAARLLGITRSRLLRRIDGSPER